MLLGSPDYYRLIPVGPDMAADPEHYLALVIPKSLKPYFETLVRQAISEVSVVADAKIHSKNKDVEDEENFVSEIKSAEFIHTFTRMIMKDDLKHKFRDYDDEALRGKLHEEGFSLFKDYRSKITRWYEAGQHLVLKLTGKGNSRDFIKTEVCFSPAVIDRAAIHTCKLKIQQTTKNCETALTDSRY